MNKIKKTGNHIVLEEYTHTHTHASMHVPHTYIHIHTYFGKHLGDCVLVSYWKGCLLTLRTCSEDFWESSPSDSHPRDDKAYEGL